MTGQTENTTFAEPSHAVAIKQGDADNYWKDCFELNHITVAFPHNFKFFEKFFQNFLIRSLYFIQL